MTEPTSFDEVGRRIECGIAGIREAAYLVDLLERMTYPDNRPDCLCRVCGLPRHMGHEQCCTAWEIS
ncbi:MAG: hypothetical protein GQ578_09725 [Desulfuromonadaceae bacterium]|nr:hypothetical protein [Desulfuromonadaceae bacterium]